jgi:RNA recognition motif-containing protein
VHDFGNKLSLNVYGLNVHHDISTNIVSEDELVTYFGKRSSLNGWKVKPCD